jgi:uncharacterized protein YPO0396
MVIRLEDKAARESASATEKENLVARRQQEIAKLKEQLKAANTEIRKVNRVLRDAGLAGLVAELPAEMTAEDTTTSTFDTAMITAEIGEDVRKRSAALAERLQKAKAVTGRDGAIREEIASIAANMVALTALSEGPASPIRTLLVEAAEKNANDRVSLADRAAAIIADPPRAP